MWTPKRVLVLALGFALLFAFYLVYAHYLGGIDGLPPLPESGLRADGPIPPPTRVRDRVDDRLVMAFGEACKELDRPIRLEIHTKGIVLSTEDFKILHDGGEHDGQVRLTPMSLAVFAKKTIPGQYPEITTVKAKTAYLTFDRPINTMQDMARGKIVGAELHDQIEIVNNRRKPRTSNEELYVYVPKGPVFYRERPRGTAGSERRPEIWTDTVLDLTDYQCKPNPTRINAEGMELFLGAETPDASPGPPVARKPRNETVNGVERILLRSNVRMELYTDPRSGFMSTADKPKPAAAPAAKNASAAKAPPPATEPKVPIYIETAGPFVYDVPKDLARFNIPSNPSQLSPHRVHVTRITKPGQFDQLECDQLELQFRRKKAADGKAAAVNEDRSVELEIETAHATGKEVVLTSDAEDLHVLEANDFYYEATTRKTTIMGEQEVVVSKDGHKLQARKLFLQEIKGVQQMTALGPGTIAMLDKETNKRSITATWKDKLVSSKQGEQDVLLLTGEANFTDTEHGQLLQGDELKVWLEPSAKATPKPAASAPNQGGRRPQRVEATGRVVAKSAEMDVHDTDKLILTFRDAPPSPPPGEKPGPPGIKPLPAVVTPTPAPTPLAGKADPAKPARPINLSAHLVEARILRGADGKNELERLWTEGQVMVHQPPEKPEEKGLDIKSETLELTKQQDGNLLVVTGDVAELQIDKLFIRGPQIKIDQAVNEAWVKGIGALTMKNNTGFNGNKLEREVDMTVYWSEYMHFQGAHADFRGGVQAEQENSRLACHSLQVELDQPISFREGQKSGKQAKVKSMVCDKSVSVEDSEYQNGKLLKWQKIECRELCVDNLEGTAHGSGPGTVRLYQQGDAGPQVGPLIASPAASPKPTPAAKDQEMKLTIVTFVGKIWLDNKAHVVSFFQDIEVLHLPTENKDLIVDLDREELPHDAVFLRCADQLKVYNRPENGKSNQQLEGVGRVECRTKEYVAQSDKVTYHEGKDQLIFDGGDDGWARMRKLGAPGGPGQRWEAKKIIYLRKTGEIQSIRGRGASGVTGQ